MSYQSPKGEILSAHSYSQLTHAQKQGFKASQEKPTHKTDAKGEITEIVPELKEGDPGYVPPEGNTDGEDNA